MFYAAQKINQVVSIKHQKVSQQALTNYIHLLHNGNKTAHGQVVDSLQEVHLVGVGAKEDGSDGERRRVSGHSDVAHVVADGVHVHEGRPGCVYQRKGTVREGAVQDEQIEFALQQVLCLWIRQHGIAALQVCGGGRYV